MSDRDDLIPRLAEAIHAVDDAGCAELPDGGQCETCTARAVAALRIVRGTEGFSRTPRCAPDTNTAGAAYEAEKQLIDQAARVMITRGEPTPAALELAQEIVTAGWRPPLSGDVIEGAARALHEYLQPNQDCCEPGPAGVCLSCELKVGVLADAGLLHEPPDDDGCGWKQRYEALRSQAPRCVCGPLGSDQEAVRRAAKALKKAAFTPDARSYTKMARVALRAAGEGQHG